MGGVQRKTFLREWGCFLRETWENFQKFPFCDTSRKQRRAGCFLGRKGEAAEKRAGRKQQQPGGMKKNCKNGKNRPQNLDE